MNDPMGGRALLPGATAMRIALLALLILAIAGMLGWFSPAGAQGALQSSARAPRQALAHRTLGHQWGADLVLGALAQHRFQRRGGGRVGGERLELVGVLGAGRAGRCA